MGLDLLQAILDFIWIKHKVVGKVSKRMSFTGKSIYAKFFWSIDRKANVQFLSNKNDITCADKIDVRLKWQLR